MQTVSSFPIVEQRDNTDDAAFQSINKGYDSIFRPGRMSIGLVAPLEGYINGPVPCMTRHLERIRLAEELGFSAVWLRDVPFNVPSFGDAGQVYDPFVYLGLLAGQTERIALGVASIILPLRHPAHVAKAAASADSLSGGRLVLGVASGDRPEEYPALNMSFEERGARFRDSYEYIRQMSEDRPVFENSFGNPAVGLDMLPKPDSGKLPLLITGGSQQDAEWIARNGDGWMVYPRDPIVQSKIIHNWRNQVMETGRRPQPAMQPLYVDFTEDKLSRPESIHLGFRSGADYLITHLSKLREIGINHVALNLRFNQADIETTMKRMADEILPHFT